MAEFQDLKCKDVESLPSSSLWAATNSEDFAENKIGFTNTDTPQVDHGKSEICASSNQSRSPVIPYEQNNCANTVEEKNKASSNGNSHVIVQSSSENSTKPKVPFVCQNASDEDAADEENEVPEKNDEEKKEAGHENIGNKEGCYPVFGCIICKPSVKHQIKHALEQFQAKKKQSESYVLRYISPELLSEACVKLSKKFAMTIQQTDLKESKIKKSKIFTVKNKADIDKTLKQLMQSEVSNVDLFLLVLGHCTKELFILTEHGPIAVLEFLEIVRNFKEVNRIRKITVYLGICWAHNVDKIMLDDLSMQGIEVVSFTNKDCPGFNIKYKFKSELQKRPDIVPSGEPVRVVQSISEAYSKQLDNYKGRIEIENYNGKTKIDNLGGKMKIDNNEGKIEMEIPVISPAGDHMDMDYDGDVEG